MAREKVKLISIYRRDIEHARNDSVTISLRITTPIYLHVKILYFQIKTILKFMTRYPVAIRLSVVQPFHVVVAYEVVVLE